MLLETHNQTGISSVQTKMVEETSSHKMTLKIKFLPHWDLNLGSHPIGGYPLRSVLLARLVATACVEGAKLAED